MIKWKLFLITILITGAAIYSAYLIFPQTHTLGALKFSVGQAEITKKVNQIMSELDLIPGKYHTRMNLQMRSELIRQVQQEHGLARGNAMLRESVPGYYWDISWLKEENFIRISTSEGKKDERKVQDQEWEKYRKLEFQFDLRGNLIGMQWEIPDSTALPPLKMEVAKQLAYQFLKKYTGLPLVESTQASPDTTAKQKTIYLDPVQKEIGSGKSVLTIQDNQRIEYDFTWKTYLPELVNQLEVKVKVTGSTIKSLQLDYQIPEKYKNIPDQVAIGILIAIFFIVTTILVIVLAFKKSRQYELSFKTAAALAVLMGLLYMSELYFLLKGESGWEILIPLVIAPLFVAGSFVIAWAVSESVGRETWKEKFIPLDLITSGHILHSKIGESFSRGLIFGSLAYLVQTGLVWLVSRVIPLSSVYLDQDFLRFFSTFSPALVVISHSFWTSLYLLAIIFLLIVSFLQGRLGNRFITIIFAAIPLAIITGGMIYPVYVGFIIESLAAGLLVWSFYRYDALSAFWALFIFSILDMFLSLLHNGQQDFTFSVYIFFFVFAATLIYAGLTFISRDKVRNYEEIEPVISKHISERQRMQQELEIAREVQMSFLPHQDPVFKGLDIASRCIPALEVGGDYYDFITLGDHRLGVVVGDVSGKGTKAAFYMTLVKGYLKALARVSYSPMEILKQMNALVYESATRETFISMVFGVFDTGEKIVTLARSGHNPVILHRSREQKLDVIQTEGLALGLEKGALFDRTIRDIKITFQSGDLFVFYTDGFTEAMDRQKNEFGEDRLLETVKKYAGGTAGEVLNGIFKEVKIFIKTEKPHDDMTMVVVKIV